MTTPTTTAGVKTLVYAPQVRIVISTGSKEIDISRDVIRGKVTRDVNAVSLAEFTINNKGRKYTGILKRMDKVSIWLKRVCWIQVFSGYLDIVPAFDLFPVEAYIKASCTLKRLKYTYWDSGLPASQELLLPDTFRATIDGTNPGLDNPDAGTGLIIKDLLVKVGKWPEDQIMIQQIPKAFLDFARDNIRLVDDSEVYDQLLRYLQPAGAANGFVIPWSTYGQPPTPDNGDKYTIERIASVVKFVWSSATPTAQAKAVAIAWAASAGNPTLVTGSDEDRKYGIFQVSLADYPHYTSHALFNIVEAARIAFEISNRGRDFSYWQGSYDWSRYMNQAESLIHSDQVPPYSPNGGFPITSGAPGAPGAGVLQTLFSQFYGGPGLGGAGAPGVVAYARSKLGSPYVLGSPATPDATTFDCSSLVKLAYATAGVNLQRVAYNQCRQTIAYRVIPTGANGKYQESDLLPGDLLFSGSADDHEFDTSDNIPPTGHVAMYAGGGRVVEAKGVAWGVIEGTLSTTSGSGTHANPRYWIGKTHTVTRPSPMAYQSGEDTGAWSWGNQSGGTVATYRLFNLLFREMEVGYLSQILQGEFQPANDVPLLGSVSQVCSGSLRSFMSAPNGDFIAFFPDYFGINGTDAVWNLEDIEMINFNMMINDDELVTHVYTLGDTDESFSINAADWLQSSGYVSIFQNAIMNNILNMMSSDGAPVDPNVFVQRFGIRPMVNQLQIIRNHFLEFFSSLHTFLQQWSRQFSTLVELTFMPEVYPGMRINLVNHGISVYVEQVTHVFDYVNGFLTYPTISSPSTKEGGFGGLPIGPML